MTSSDSTTSPWVNLGRALGAHRVHLGFSKRKAASAAGFSEATWRQLEEGKRTLAPGHVVEMSARPETIVAAARAVGMDPSEALALVGFRADSLEAVVRAATVSAMEEARRHAESNEAKPSQQEIIDSAVSAIIEMLAEAPPTDSITQLVVGIAEELRLLRVELQRLGAAYEQLVTPAPVPPPLAVSPPRRGSRATSGGST